MDAIVSSGIVFATMKGYGVVNELDIPTPIYIQASAMMGASKIISNYSTRDPVMRAFISGAIYAGASFALFKDNNYAMNGTLGAIASYGADILLTKYVDENTNE